MSRRNLPSASGLEALALCPGKWQLEQRAPVEIRDANTDAEANFGTRVHAWLAGEEITLTPEEQDVADECRRQESELLKEHVPGAIMLREQRIWLHEHLEPCFSGQADLIAFDHSRGVALVADYKSLHGDVAAAPRNMQLRALAVLASLEVGAGRVVTAIIQPAVSRKPVVCAYEADDLTNAEREVRGILSRAFDVRANRIPGEKQCRYCKAKQICPEAQASAGVIVAHQDRLAAMTGPQLSDFLAICEQAKSVVKMAETLAKARLAEDPASVPGWTLAQGAKRRTVTNIEAVHSALVTRGVPHESFLKACSVGISDVESLVRDATGKKGKDLKEEVAACLEGAVETKETAKTLAKEN